MLQGGRKPRGALEKGGHGGFRRNSMWRQGPGSWLRSGSGAEAAELVEARPRTGWLPVTKLGRLVKDMKIKSLKEIYLFSLPIKESKSLTFSEHP